LRSIIILKTILKFVYLPNYSFSSGSVFEMILKKINNFLRKFLRFSVCLSLSGQLLLLPYLHFSKAHLHMINGTIVAHWHISKGFSEKNPNSKKPFARHNHSLAEIFNLWNVRKSLGIPATEYQPVIFITCELHLPPLKEEIQGEIFVFFPSGRSPPAMRTV